MQPLLGLTGRARAGKNTVANVLTNHFYYTDYALAAQLKIFAGNLGLTSHSVFFDDELKDKAILRNGATPRELLQQLGSLARTFFNPDIWIFHFEKKLGNLIGQIPIVITDIRYNNEAEWIKDNNGKIIEISRPAYKNKVSDHPSEDGIFKKYIDFELHNDYPTVDLFKEYVKKRLEVILK